MYKPKKNYKVGDLQPGMCVFIRDTYFAEVSSIVILGDYRKIYFCPHENGYGPKSLMYSADTLVAISGEPGPPRVFSGWIRVIDSIPPENSSFLAVVKGEVLLSHVYEHKDYTKGIEDWLNLMGIIYWMPLPNPPGDEYAKN